MKLKSYSAINCATVRTAKPCISISTKSGLINFNSELCNKVGLKEGMLVMLHQDEEKEEDWYLEVVKADGFALRKKENVGKGLLFNNTTVARAIAESVAYQKTSGRVFIGAEAIKIEKRQLWPLITASLRN